MSNSKCNLVVLSAPSGAGKTTIAKHLVERNKHMTISVSATTRPKRPAETEGIDYLYLSHNQFTSFIEQKKFLEYEKVHNHYYGTLKDVVDALIADGKTVVFDIDVNGALAIKNFYPDACLIFIKAPSLNELRRRLRDRKSETPEAIKTRLDRIDYEYKQAAKFDFTVINRNIEKTVVRIEQLISV